MNKPRGLAALSPERRREIASMGGKAAQAKGCVPHWTREQAVAAGRKGGQATASKIGIARMRELAREGGLQKGRNAQARREAEESDG